MTHLRQTLGRIVGIAMALWAAFPAPSHSDEPVGRRMLYVADAHRVIGQTDAEDALLARARAWDVRELALYGLGPLLDDGTRWAALATFAQRASMAGVALVAPIAGTDRARALRRFEEAHPEARFAGWVTELEYWNRCGTDGESTREGTRACFAPLAALVREMSITDAPPGESRRWIGVYLGYPTRAEARWIARHADRVFLSHPGRSPAHATARRRNSLRDPDERVARFAGTRVELWPILYARGEAPMRDWLREHGLVPSAMREAERELVRRSRRARFAGFAWFDDAGLASLDR